MALVLVTGPESEPVSLQEAKDQCRVTVADDDVILDVYRAAARWHCEVFTRRAILSQTWRLVLDAFPGETELEIPRPPLQSVSSIKYTGPDDVEATFASAGYVVATAGQYGRVVLRSGYSWPGVTLKIVEGVAVEFLAGYGDGAADVPQDLRLGMLLLIGHWYENREATVAVGNMQVLPFGVKSLWWNYRAWRFPAPDAPLPRPV